MFNSSRQGKTLINHEREKTYVVNDTRNLARNLYPKESVGGTI